MDAITIRVRTDPELKGEADRLFSELGLSFSTAVNMFLR
jgi:DNA-damage-inducible protein J